MFFFPVASIELFSNILELNLHFSQLFFLHDQSEKYNMIIWNKLYPRISLFIDGFF